MNNLKLVSIIIPTYNRAKYIIETLNSIRDQSYVNFECLVIDDNSVDETDLLLKNYCVNDNRFSFYKRPEKRVKGANSCRNYGFKISKGDYIKFFDSDDLMHPQHIEILVKIIEENDLDFAVADIQNFDESGFQNRVYEIDRSKAEISAFNFALHQVAWCTVDFLGKRSICESLEFNEKIRDNANEYQYYIKLLCLTTNGKLIEDILTWRRLHPNSMTSKLHSDPVNFQKHLAELKLFTLEHIEKVAPPHLIKWLLSGHIQINFELARQKHRPDYLFKSFNYLAKYYTIPKALAYLGAICSGFLLGKGYNIIKAIRK
ncbi:glycosyltransferase family 2 protein [Leeuwenhoekiella parthenopeia]|uniref:Glycosyltransferase family 2 protein n=1 Tax=Leeuwenhoekiella parthenopeia TaxID=2890320 RepID=A0ABS8GXM6_9FLAO|nr:glycosyltransferase family 2 protein [Leeuwenhoekiella parthenopeia]MCC4214659.1 glycosyltransferase family 2 protein [Leeuwenhoekiella parthenopeia]